MAAYSLPVIESVFKLVAVVETTMKVVAVAVLVCAHACVHDARTCVCICTFYRPTAI